MDQRPPPRPTSSQRPGDPDDGHLVLPPGVSPSQLITSLAKNAWSSPKVKAGLVLWIIGLSFITFAPALVKTTPEMVETYQDMSLVTSEEMFDYDEALSQLSVAESKLYDSQSWFWRFRPDDRAIVEKNQEEVSLKRSKVDALIAQRAEKQKKANAYIGIWSDYGMQEVREKFWNSFEGGKVFAQRQTFWQMLHSILTSRDEYFLSLILRWVFVALFNFTLGLLGSLFYFAYTLGYMILSYEPDPFSGLAFLILSLLGGISIVATYLIGLYGMAASGVYFVGKVALRNAIQHQHDQQQRQRQEGLRFKRE